MGITRNELIRQFATKNDPLQKYWTSLLSHVALQSSENGVAGGTITDSAIFYVQYGLGTHTGQFLFDFAAVSNAVQADTSSPPAACSHKIQCRVGGATFWIPGYTSI